MSHRVPLLLGPGSKRGLSGVSMQDEERLLGLLKFLSSNSLLLRCAELAPSQCAAPSSTSPRKDKRVAQGTWLLLKTHFCNFFFWWRDRVVSGTSCVTLRCFWFNICSQKHFHHTDKCGMGELLWHVTTDVTVGVNCRC